MFEIKSFKDAEILLKLIESNRKEMTADEMCEICNLNRNDGKVYTLLKSFKKDSIVKNIGFKIINGKEIKSYTLDLNDLKKILLAEWDIGKKLYELAWEGHLRFVPKVKPRVIPSSSL